MTASDSSGSNPDCRLLLVRHGESTWNVEHRWAGQADAPLTDTGREQAHALAHHLSEFVFDSIVSSDLVRAAETARLISDELAGPAPIKDRRLRERSSVWSGLTSAEIERSHPGQLEAWRNGQLRDLPPGSETWVEFVSRVGEAIVAHGRGGTVLAVAHAGLFRAVEALYDVPVRRVGNTGGQWLHIRGDGIVPGPPL